MSEERKELNEIKEQCEKRVQEEKRELGILTPGKEPISDKFMERCYWDDQDGDSDLFRRLYEGRVVFDENEGNWYVWTDHCWQRFKMERVVYLIRDLVKEYRRMQFRMKKLADGETSNEELAKAHRKMGSNYKKRASALQKVTRKRSVVSLARTLPEMLFDGEWDQCPMKLACANGVLNLKTFELEEGKPGDYIRTACPVEYDPDAKCPTWERFLLEIFDGDQDVVDYLQKIFGYAITGLGNINRFYVFYGEHGQNGKGTMLEVLFKILGDVASPIQSEMLLDRGMAKNPDAPSAAMHDLYGKRIIWGSETDDGRRFSAAAVKFLSGGDTIWCRAPHAPEPVKFPPTHCLFLLTNHFPGISASETPFWTRCRIIEFPLSFVEKPRQDHERQYDPELKVKLEAEASGILRWIVDGCKKWQADEFALPMPEAVKKATYGEREKADTCLKFFRAVCAQDEEYKIGATDLHVCFKYWAIKNGYATKKNVWKQQKFGREMTSFVKRTPGLAKTPETASHVEYLGFSVTEEFWNEAMEQRSEGSANGQKKVGS